MFGASDCFFHHSVIPSLLCKSHKKDYCVFSFLVKLRQCQGLPGGAKVGLRMTGIVQAWPKMSGDKCGPDYCVSDIYSNRTGLVSECKKVRLMKQSKERISKCAVFLHSVTRCRFRALIVTI